MYVLIDHSLGNLIAIVHDDRDDRRDDRVAMRRCTFSRLARWLLRCQVLPRYETLNTNGGPGPPEAIDMQVSSDGGPLAIFTRSGHDHHGPFGSITVDGIKHASLTAGLPIS